MDNDYAGSPLFRDRVIADIKTRMMFLERKDNWTTADRNTFTNLGYRLKKLTALKELDLAESKK